MSDNPDWEDLEFVSCWKCDGEGFIITCIDDLCQSGCIHGDGEQACRVCNGSGEVYAASGDAP